MSKATYRDIPSKLVRRESFQGNSMSAHWVGDTYYVLSYETTLATWDRITDTWEVDETYYSQTTSRHQNLVETWGVGGPR